MATASQIGQVYRDHLGRSVDQAGLDYWLAQVSRGATLADITTAVRNSSEGITRATSIISGYYQTSLGRAPDPAGLNWWLDQYRSGASLPDIHVGIYNSSDAVAYRQQQQAAAHAAYVQAEAERVAAQEAQAKAEAEARAKAEAEAKAKADAEKAKQDAVEQAAKSAQNATIVDSIFREFLNRPADADGLKYWQEQLDKGAKIEDVAKWILETPEGQIAQAYERELGRKIDDEGRDYWKDQLAQGAKIDDIIGYIDKSSEGTIAQAYQDILGRQADKEGMTFWREELERGTPIEDIIAAISGSQEALARDPIQASKPPVKEEDKGKPFDLEEYKKRIEPYGGGWTSWSDQPQNMKYFDEDILRQVLGPEIEGTGDGAGPAVAWMRWAANDPEIIKQLEIAQADKFFREHISDPANRNAVLEQFGYASPDSEAATIAMDWRGEPVAIMDKNGRMITWRPTTDLNNWVTRDDIGDIQGFTDSLLGSSSLFTLEDPGIAGQSAPVFSNAHLTSVAFTPPTKDNWLIPAGIFAAVLAPALAPTILGMSGTAAMALQTKILTNIATTAAITTGLSVAQGVPLEQAIQNGVMSMLGSGLGSVAGAAASSAAASAGFSEITSRITNIASQSATSAAVAAVSGGDPVQAAIAAGISGSLNAFMPDILRNIEGFDQLPTTAQKALERAVATTVNAGIQGKDPTQALLMSLLNTALSTTQDFIGGVIKGEGFSLEASF